MYEAAAPNQLAPFYQIDGIPSAPGRTSFVSIIDGTSNTLMMSECLRAQTTGEDWRGDFHNDAGQFNFMAIYPPNSSTPGAYPNGADVELDAYCSKNNDPLMPVVCATSTAGQQFSARSRHFGGVNVCMCDGSVHFILNTIDLAVWQAIATMNGGEAVAESY
jgi:prepilin-type processing-associated H-X9-DG protein